MSERISRKSFVRLGAAMGVGAAGSSLVAACGGSAGGNGQAGGGGYGAGGSGGRTSRGSASSEAPGAASVPSAAGQSPAGQEIIARTSEVPPKSAKTFEDSGKPAVLVRLQNGDFAAYSAVCTHQSCTVAYQGGQLACPCHGSVFDPENGGQVLNGPAQAPLPEIPVKVQGGSVIKS